MAGPKWAPKPPPAAEIVLPPPSSIVPGRLLVLSLDGEALDRMPRTEQRALYRLLGRARTHDGRLIDLPWGGLRGGAARLGPALWDEDEWRKRGEAAPLLTQDIADAILRAVAPFGIGGALADVTHEYRFFATSASVSYDSTSTFGIVPFAAGYQPPELRDLPNNAARRVVAIAAHDVEWQTARYWSGSHRPWEVQLAEVHQALHPRAAEIPSPTRHAPPELSQPPVSPKRVTRVSYKTLVLTLHAVLRELLDVAYVREQGTSQNTRFQVSFTGEVPTIEVWVYKATLPYVTVGFVGEEPLKIESPSVNEAVASALGEIDRLVGISQCLKSSARRVPEAPGPARKPPALPAPSAARETYPSGFLVPREGERVFRMVAGFGGTPAYVSGVVYSASAGRLRVRIGEVTGMFAGAAAQKTTALTPAWIVDGDPELARREAAKQQAKDEEAQAEREGERLAELARQEAIAGGALPVSMSMFNDGTIRPGGILRRFWGKSGYIARYTGVTREAPPSVGVTTTVVRSIERDDRAIYVGSDDDNAPRVIGGPKDWALHVYDPPRVRQHRLELPGPSFTPRRPRVPEAPGPAWRAPIRRTPEMPGPAWKPPETATVGAVLATAPAAAATEGRAWSEYQRAIFDAIRKDTRNIVIVARAGSGKTTVAIEALRHIPTDKRILFAAFNKNIRDELKHRAPPHVEVRTLHQHGLLTLNQYWQGLKIGDADSGSKEQDYSDKIRNQHMNDAARIPPWVRRGTFARTDKRKTDDLFNDGWNREKEQLLELIDLSKGLMALTPDAIRRVQADYGLLRGVSDGPWRFLDRRYSVSYDQNSIDGWVMAALQFSLTPPVDGYLSFADMVFVPAATPTMSPHPLFDFVFVDETQDMDVAQLALVRKSVVPGTGRIVVIGDPAQSIYRFRGADTQAIPRMIRELQALMLPLSMSYRVPECSAREARNIVPDFHALPGAPEGTCADLPARDLPRKWDNGDFVISYTNAPLIPLAMIAVVSGKNPLALGLVDLSLKLKTVIEGATRRKPVMGNLEEFLREIDAWHTQTENRILLEEEQRRQKFKRRYSSAKDDDADSPRVVELRYGVEAAKAIVRASSTIDEAYQRIDALSVPPKTADKLSDEERRRLTAGRLVFSTVHKIKGAEAWRTFILEETFRFNRTGFAGGKVWQKMSEPEKIEAQNLFYVAITRVKNLPGKPGELYYVQGLKFLLGGSGDEG